MSARRLSVALALCLAMTVGTKDARAQFSPGARSAGMAGAGLVFATGLDAVEWNPANLAWSNGWDVSLFEFGAAGLLTGTTIEDLIEIASAGGDGDATVVSRLPADGFTLSTTLEGFAGARAASVADLPEVGSSIPTVGIAIGPVALRVRSRLMAEASMSRELADLTVTGYNPERIREYAVRNTAFRAASFTEITLGYGVTIGERLALGLGVRSVRGHGLSQGRFFEPGRRPGRRDAGRHGCGGRGLRWVGLWLGPGHGARPGCGRTGLLGRYKFHAAHDVGRGVGRAPGGVLRR